MQLIDLKDYILSSDFDTFKNILNSGGIVKGIKININGYSRKIIDELTDWLKDQFSVKGLAFIKCNDGNKFEGGISKFFTEKVQSKIIADLDVKSGDIIFIIGDKPKITLPALGALRLRLAQKENLIDKNKWAPLWVVDFPLFDWNEEHQRWDSLHHLRLPILRI